MKTKTINVRAKPNDTVFAIITLLKKDDDKWVNYGYVRILKATVLDVTVSKNKENYSLLIFKSDIELGDTVDGELIFNSELEALKYLPTYWKKYKDPNFEI